MVVISGLLGSYHHFKPFLPTQRLVVVLLQVQGVVLTFVEYLIDIQVKAKDIVQCSLKSILVGFAIF